MNKALDFLEIQKLALEAKTQKALGFVITNQTLKLFDYKQAIFWTGESSSPRFQSVSGNAVFDEKGPYTLWLKHIIKRQYPDRDRGNPVALKGEDIADDHEQEWCAKHILILYLFAEDGEEIGGVWLERDTAFKDAEQALLNEMRPTWEARICLINTKERANFLSGWRHLKKRQKYIWIALILLALFPVRLTITAPAEIVAENKMVASVPYDGVVKSIAVEPGESVKQGQTLAVMEREELESQAQNAARALETAESALARLKREALVSPEKKTELNLLEAEIDAKKIEYKYANSMLERSTIKSPRDGVAIFADVNEYQGKPVTTGETLMEIAAPGDIELLARVPVDALIPFSKTDPLHFYLNVSPLSKIDARITTIGYQASPDPDGLLTYKLRAQLEEGTEDIRIGWKGTAKIYGDWTILAYSIIRRPLIALRRASGS